jgi:hypothetical protein
MQQKLCCGSTREHMHDADWGLASAAVCLFIELLLLLLLLLTICARCMLLVR